MPTIKNGCWKPVTVELLKGATIVLAARQTRTISDADFQSAGCQQLYRAGKLYVVPEKKQPHAAEPPAKAEN